MPIDIVVFGFLLGFMVLETVIALASMSSYLRGQASLFYLRNATAKVFTSGEKIKTSKEIEDELFYYRPELYLINKKENGISNFN